MAICGSRGCGSRGSWSGRTSQSGHVSTFPRVIQHKCERPAEGSRPESSLNTPGVLASPHQLIPQAGLGWHLTEPKLTRAPHAAGLRSGSHTSGDKQSCMLLPVPKSCPGAQLPWDARGTPAHPQCPHILPTKLVRWKADRALCLVPAVEVSQAPGRVHVEA